MDAESFYGGDWIFKSRCWNEPVDPELFHDRYREEQAKEFCQFCPVKGDCAAFATRFDLDGVFGGLNSRQRRNRATRQNNYALKLVEQMKELLQGNEPPNAA